MTYTNSSLAVYKKLSPNHSGERTHAIDRITPHCVVGQSTVESLGEVFYKPERKASSNYGIGKDGKIALYVEEKNRSWCSSSASNDHRAITIECASDTKEPYKMNDEVYASLVKLCVDICKRYNKKKLLWIPDSRTALNYVPKDDEMLITVHRWFAAKACPGEWLYSRLDKLAAEVTNELVAGNVIYKVQVGAFSKKENADKLSKELKAKGYDNFIVKKVELSSIFTSLKVVLLFTYLLWKSSL